MDTQDQLAFQHFYSQAQAYLKRGAFDYAQANLEQALLFKSHYTLLLELAHLCLQQDHYPQGIKFAQEALALAPQSINGWGILGNLQRLNREYEFALQSYQQGLAYAQNPQQRARLRFNQSLCYLALGEHVKGFEAFLAKRQVGDDPAPPAIKSWQGENLAGKRLLLQATEGLGDTLQWIRFLPRLYSKNTTLICPDSLHRLLAHNYPELKLLRPTATFNNGDYDFYAPLYVLPAYLHPESRQQTDSLPPYLKTPPAARSKCKQRQEFASAPRFKIGINWACNPDSPTSARRSIPLQSLAPLLQQFASHTELQFYSLQWGAAREQLQQLPAVYRPIDLMNSVSDLSDMAAHIQDLDLVITIDTAIAHLSGALGQPCWVLLPFAHSWRWHFEPPWYRQQQQFTQDQPGHWQSVLKDVSTALRQHLKVSEETPPGKNLS